MISRPTIYNLKPLHLMAAVWLVPIGPLGPFSGAYRVWVRAVNASRVVVPFLSSNRNLS